MQNACGIREVEGFNGRIREGRVKDFFHTHFQRIQLDWLELVLLLLIKLVIKCRSAQQIKVVCFESDHADSILIRINGRNSHLFLLGNLHVIIAQTVCREIQEKDQISNVHPYHCIICHYL